MHRIIILCFVTLFIGCDESIEETKTSFNESFINSYKESFVTSCIKSSGSEDFREVCSCMALDLVENHAVSELMDSSKTEKYLKEVAIERCRR